MTTKPITDKAEVSIDFPDKFYMGSFGRESLLEVTADDQGAHITLERKGEQSRRVAFHLHHYLLADLIEALGQEIAAAKAPDEVHRDRLERAVQTLAKAVRPRRKRHK